MRQIRCPMHALYSIQMMTSRWFSHADILPDSNSRVCNVSVIRYVTGAELTRCCRRYRTFQPGLHRWFVEADWSWWVLILMPHHNSVFSTLNSKCSFVFVLYENHLTSVEDHSCVVHRRRATYRRRLTMWGLHWRVHAPRVSIWPCYTIGCSWSTLGTCAQYCQRRRVAK